MYADDTPVRGWCARSKSSELQERLTACISDVAAWIYASRLQLNTAKTELLWYAANRRHPQIPQEPLVAADTAMPASAVFDCGIYLDSEVSMRTRHAHRFQLLHCAQAASHRMSVGVKAGSAVVDCCVGQHTLRLRQRSPSRRIRLHAPSTAVRPERCCSNKSFNTAASARRATSQKSSLAQRS
jgi:hypothetical protein